MIQPFKKGGRGKYRREPLSRLCARPTAALPVQESTAHLARARESPSKTSSSPSSLHVEHKDRERSRSLVRPLDDSPLQTELAPPVELAVLPTSLSVLAVASRSSCVVVKPTDQSVTAKPNE